MLNPTCSACKKNIAPVWVKCLHCGAVLPKTEAEKTAADQAAKAALQKAFEAKHQAAAELSSSDKAINASLFVLSVPFLVPALLATAVMVKRWGRISGIHLAIDAVIMNALAFSLKAHWGGTKAPPTIISVLPTAVLIGTVAMLVLWFRRKKGGEEDAGMLLGYSANVVFGLIVGSLLTLIPLLIIMDSAAGGKTYFALILGVVVLGFTLSNVINES